MRTTVSIDDALLDRVKERARAQGKTLGEVFEESLHRYLALPAPTGPSALPVFDSGTGMARGIDPTSNAEMFAAVDAEDEAAVAQMLR